MSEPQNLSQRLTAMLSSILGGESPNSLSDVHAAVASILGPQGAQVSLNDLLVNLTRDGLADLKTVSDGVWTVDGHVADVHAVLTAMAGQNTATYNRVSELLTVTGDELTDLENTWSVRGGLWQIYKLLILIRKDTRALVMGGLYDDTGSSVPSSGTLVVEGRRYVIWSPAMGDGTVADGGRTFYRPSWDGWSILLQTPDPAPRVGVGVVPPGSWFPLEGVSSLQASCEQQYPITAYLRNDNAAPTEPVVLWGEVNAAPFVPAELPGVLAYAWIELPEWLTAVKLSINSTGCNGGYQWRNLEAQYIDGVNTNGCWENTVVTRPTGAHYLLYFSGGSEQRATGTIWGLPEGVTA